MFGGESYLSHASGMNKYFRKDILRQRRASDSINRRSSGSMEAKID
jgi:hypothetical protein